MNKTHNVEQTGKLLERMKILINPYDWFTNRTDEW